MKLDTINKILAKILEQNFTDIHVVKEQMKDIVISNIEELDNNKFITFVMQNDKRQVRRVKIRTLSIMFLEKTNNIPIDCILFFKNGMIDSLEIYSCDLQSFYDIDMKNIEIKMIDQNLIEE